jgi:hypothetical protein
VLRGDSPPLLETEPAATEPVTTAVAGDECVYCAVPECALNGLMLSRHSPGGVVRVVAGAVVAADADAARAVSAAKLCRVIEQPGCSTSRAVAPASEPCVCSAQ